MWYFDSDECGYDLIFCFSSVCNGEGMICCLGVVMFGFVWCIFVQYLDGMWEDLNGFIGIIWIGVGFQQFVVFCVWCYEKWIGVILVKLSG